LNRWHETATCHGSLFLGEEWLVSEAPKDESRFQRSMAFGQKTLGVAQGWYE